AKLRHGRSGRWRGRGCGRGRRRRRWRRGRRFLLAARGEHRQRDPDPDDCQLPFTEHELRLQKYYLPQTGRSLRPCLVSCCRLVPSPRIEWIRLEPWRVEAKTMWAPSGAQDGFSFLPAPLVSWLYFRDATSITKIFHAPAA